MKIIQNQQGYIALITVIIVLTVGIIIGVTVSLNSINEIQLGYSNMEGEKLFIIADACAEEAMLRIKKGQTPPTTPDFGFTQGSCTIQVIDLDANTKEVRVTGALNNNNSLIKINITHSPEFKVNNWEQVGEF